MEDCLKQPPDVWSLTMNTMDLLVPLRIGFAKRTSRVKERHHCLTLRQRSSFRRNIIGKAERVYLYWRRYVIRDRKYLA